MKDYSLFVNGIGSRNRDSIASNIEDVFLESANNLEWLSPGDLVLLKPALNSSDPYPSTSHPLAVQVVSKILRNNGAKVVVGDQSGIRTVLHHPRGVIHGNTGDNYIKSGMGSVGDENFKGFEEEGWNEGFYHHTSLKTSSWKNGFYITRWIQQADHIINLPRISTHTQAGATLGFKNMIGFLRDDSRMEYHANGPYNLAIKISAVRSSLKSIDDHKGTFFEKIVEISDALRDKLRLTLFVATKAQVTFGPNSQVLKLGPLKVGNAYVMDLHPGLVFSSSDPVAAESFALATLKHLRMSLPFLTRIYESLVLFSNSNIALVDRVPIKDHPYIKHSLDIGLGKMTSDIQYKNVPRNLEKNLGIILESD